MKTLLLLGLSAFMFNTLHAEEYPLINKLAGVAKYEVPVSEESNEYAVFELPDFEKTVSDNNLKVEYTLPAVLTGNEVRIELKGKLRFNNNEVILKGEKGSAFCSGIQSVITCKVFYENLLIDEEKAIAAIKSISTSSKEFNGRLEIMRSFSTDPVGIITY